MNIYTFMNDSPFLTFFIALILSRTILGLFVSLPKIILRHGNIKKHGYPPEWCDADGDFKKVDEDE